MTKDNIKDEVKAESQGEEIIIIEEDIISTEPILNQAVDEEIVKAEASLDKALDEVLAGETVKKKINLKKFLQPRPIIIALSVILILALAYYFKGLLIAATVNNRIISRLEVIDLLEAGSGKAALKSLIDEKLINLEADKQGLSASEEEINNELAKLEENFKKQGTSLDEILQERNLDRTYLINKIITQKKLEKLLGDKINVTDEEVEDYIKTNGVTFEAEQAADAKADLKESLKNNKLNTEATKLVEELNNQANIRYFVDYK